MNTRLSRFLAAENITRSQFADSIGVARASISHIISGRNKPSYEFIAAMLKHYPQLNPDWLILGTGKMYRDMSKAADAGAYPQPSPAVQSGDVLLFPEELPELQFNAAGDRAGDYYAGDSAGDYAGGYSPANGTRTATGSQAMGNPTTAGNPTAAGAQAGSSEGMPARTPDGTAAGTRATTPDSTPAGTPTTTPAGTAAGTFASTPAGMRTTAPEGTAAGTASRAMYGSSAGTRTSAENQDQTRAGQRGDSPVPHSVQTAPGLRPHRVSKVIVLFDDGSFQELFCQDR